MTWNSIVGWPNRIRRASSSVSAVSLLALVVAAAPADVESPPDMEFLEFLGSWQTRDGGWVDPAQIEDLPPGEYEIERDHPTRDKKSTSPKKDRRPSGVTNEPSPSPDEERRWHSPDR